MIKGLTGIGIWLIASISPDAPICQVDEYWIEAEITDVVEYEGLYEPYYVVEVTDLDGFEYIIDDLDVDYVENNKWIRDGHSIAIQVDDGYIIDWLKN